MDKDRIKELIRRYYEGETTPNEERELTCFFAQEKEVSEEWHTERHLFRQLAEIRHTLPPVPKGLEERLSLQIDEWAKEEQYTQCLQPRKKYLRWWIAGAAACLLLAGSLGVKMMQPTEEDTLTPEKAYAETERAMYLFAHTLDKGVKQMAAAQQATLRMQENINKTLNQLNE